MKKNTENSVSEGFRLLACILSAFFVLIAVFDGFEKENEIEFFEEYVAEAQVDLIDFQESISRPPGSNKVKKLDRTPIKKFFDKVFNFFISEEIFQLKSVFKFLKIFSSYNLTITNSICTNAP
ncbi:hypothetical protein SAMN00777080_2912 [Aquiflexum balticum DSM 16537]|uniref:Uncharacterized protein n=1 Tax=Aquiflexum balticum DSM 16537 TaxID=758820 RepID=A0A1W2H6N3_9BACT|nr:hypothetical protein [Aquiflexum balticum]SMD44292.1 hypothetical protein SAMN00777080_2912 [Aquiflexum balticum DSM 16537]